MKLIMYDTNINNVKFDTINISQNIYKINFISPFSTRNKIYDNAHAYLYKSKKTDKAIIFVHGTGDGSINHLSYYPKKLSKAGYTTIMPILPYHGPRKPEKINLLSGKEIDIKKRFEHCISDILSCKEYLIDLGYKEIYIMGYSLGGMLSVISMAIDNNISKGIFIVTGGNFEYITWKSVATKILRIKYEEDSECSIEKCEKLHKDFTYYCDNFKSLDELDNMPSCFTYDPALFASKIKDKPCFMINAMFDIFIPKKSSDYLWHRLGKPKRLILPAGHITSHLIFKKLILNKSLDFLKNNCRLDTLQPFF